MKIKKLILPLLIGGLAFSSAAFAIIATSKTNEIEVNATTFKTSINLKPCTSEEIKDYYAGLNGKSDAQLSGTNLLKNLKAIISNNVTYYTYSEVSKVYVITDRDWTNSPASSITTGTYDSTTQTISNFDHSSEVSENPYLHLLYCDYTVKDKTLYKGDGDVNSSQVSFDKEHAWSQSHGFDNGTQSGQNLTGAGSDLHHLKAGTQYGNRTLHSNYSYGFVKENDNNWTKAMDTYPYEQKNKRGEPLFQHSSDQQTTVFEPQDADKGDIARALLYMVAAYNNYDGSTPTPAYPALQLVNYVISGSTTGYSSESISNGYYGVLQDILAWHKLDPVDAYEIHRNDLIYRNYQGNRNPFIDYPEWVDYIWGTSTYNSSAQSISYDPTSTGHVDLDNDVINGYRSTTPVSVTGVSVSPSSKTLNIGETLQVTATISPANATNKAVTWTSSNSSVASVSSGLITAKAVGSATITATTSDGGFTASCNVTVQNGTVSVTGVNLDQDSLNLLKGETATLEATVTPNGATNKAVNWSSSNTSVATVSSSGVVTAVNNGTAVITVTTSDGGYTDTCSVTVSTSGSYTINYNDTFDPALPSTSGTVNTSATAHTDTTANNFAFKEKGLYKGSSAYIMFTNGQGYLYNTTDLGTVTKVSITYSSGVSTSAKIGVYFGNEELSEYTTEDNQLIGGKSATDVFENSDPGNGYFQISSSNYNCQIASILIEYESYSSTDPVVTNVNVSPSSLNLDLSGTKTYDLTVTVKGKNDPSTAVNWSSSDSTVATVSNTGKVTALKAGTATISATSVVTPSKSGSCEVTVIDSSNLPYSLTANSPYINGIAYKMYMYSTNKSSNYYFTGAMSGNYGASSSSIEGATDVYFESSGSGQNIYFYDSSNVKQYLCVALNGSYYNFTFASSEPSTKWYFRTLYDGDDLLYSCMTYYINNAYYTFGTYNNYTTFGAINLNTYTNNYEVEFVSSDSESPTAFAHVFKESITCDSSGNNSPTFASGTSWDLLSKVYANLDSSSQNTLRSATGDNNGTLIEKMMKRYDYIIAKYGVSTYTNFIGRNLVSLSNNITVDYGANSIIISVVTISTIAVIAFVVIRKKRYSK